MIAAPRPPEIVPVVFQPESPTPPAADDPFERPSSPSTNYPDPVPPATDPFGPLPPSYPQTTPTVYSPGRANRFYVIGHSLFVILFGLLGGAVTRRLAAKNAFAPRPETA